VATETVFMPVEGRGGRLNAYYANARKLMVEAQGLGVGKLREKYASIFNPNEADRAWLAKADKDTIIKRMTFEFMRGASDVL
jgi:hypothetical protein